MFEPWKEQLLDSEDKMLLQQHMQHHWTEVLVRISSVNEGFSSNPCLIAGG